MTLTLLSCHHGSVPVTMRTILAETARDHGFEPSDLLSIARHRALVRARWDFMCRARQVRRGDGRPRYSLPQIGRFLGGMDHTTVLHGLRGWERLTAATLAEAA